MARVNKADFYYGAMLSVMLSKGMKPALFEESENRRIYSFSTNKGDYQLYMKYVSMPTKRKKENTQLWEFIFSSDELELIKSKQDNGKKTLFGLICGNSKLNNSEMATLNLDQAKSCLGFEYPIDTHRIVVKNSKGSHGLKVYGTGLSDILKGKDNTIKIARNIINEL